MKTEPIFVPAFEKSEKSDGVFVPFEPGTRVLPAGWQAKSQFKAIPVDIVFEKDVAVTMRDGKTIYVDVLRPVGAEKVPVIVAWSPYGKAAGTGTFTPALFASLGMKPGQLSGLEKFEGPDPAYWVAQGYAVCNPDSRGIDQSEGDIAVLGHQEGEDCHDLIEWLAVQDWCNGKVGMTGTSYLAAAQWYTAAEQPPHLAAINPVEGFNDIYRHLVQRGGMPDHAFFRVLETNYAGKNRREDAIAETPLASSTSRARVSISASERRCSCSGWVMAALHCDKLSTHCAQSSHSVKLCTHRAIVIALIGDGRLAKAEACSFR
ncbi:MAG: hydrolase [Devosia sp.]|nr:hydrolase [Devosia sp.]